jgi:hypothetical protein
MSEIVILRQFKNGLVSFIDELIDQFPGEPDLVIIRIFVNDQVPIIDVMNHFVAKLLPMKTDIKDRNEKVFIESNVIFEALSKTKVNHFKALWRSGRLDDDDKQVVWKWFDSFVLLSERYKLFKKSEVSRI